MKIPVYRPFLNGNEKQYVNDCLDSSWISSRGEFLDRFEKKFQDFVEARFATSVSNGTCALHLALLALGIGAGDEVIVPSLTYVACANAIAYTGATPVFVDSLYTTWQIDPDDVIRKITPKTKAILAVHLYGHPCELDTLKAIAEKHDLFLIEDCAEAFGSYYRGTHVGGHGIVATYSFFGNKTITTGEGGMITTNDPSLFEKISALKNQGNSPRRPYWHDVLGYNYRLTNLAAAIGLAQIEQADLILTKKRAIALQYKEALKEVPLQIHQELPHCIHSYWMVSIVLDNPSLTQPLRTFLADEEIETRPFFYPLHDLPIYKKPSAPSFAVATDLSARGINLPSFPDLKTEEVTWICQKIQQFFQKNPSCYSDVEDTQEALPTFS